MLRDISLEDVSTVAEVQVKRHEHVFGIVTPARTYYVEARTRPDMQKWVAEIEQARDDFKRNKSEETTTNTENAPDTPVVRPVQAPVVAPNLSQRSQPISIVAPSSPGPHTSTSTPFSSSVATTSTSPFSPDATSSSYTSQASTLSSIPPGVPPNSLIQGGAGLLGNPVELNSVDARLESRQRQNSNASSGGDVAGPITGYFRPPRPASPGVASSSEDEDDDYVGEATTPGPSTTGGLTMASGLQFGSLDPNKVIMSGYLTKQGKRKNWRKRYFILVSSRLMYSRSHMVRCSALIS